MYICKDCWKIYDDEEVETCYECESSRKNVFVVGSCVKVDDCICGGELVKAVHCERCGSWVEVGNSLCEDCLEEYKTLETALDIGEEWDGCISLNGFLLSFYSREDIEQILLDCIRNEDEEKVNRAVERYCKEDKECFKECAEKAWREER